MFVLAILIHVDVYWRECRLPFCQGDKEAWWKNYTCALLLMWSPCIWSVYNPSVHGIWAVLFDQYLDVMLLPVSALVFIAWDWDFLSPLYSVDLACRCGRLMLDLQTGEIMRLCGRSYALLRSSVWSLFAAESSQYGEIFCEWTLVSPLIICAGQPLWSRVCFGFVAFRLLSQGEVCTTGTLCCSLWVHEAAHAGDGWQPSAHVVDHEAMMGMLCDLCRVFIGRLCFGSIMLL